MFFEGRSEWLTGARHFSSVPVIVRVYRAKLRLQLCGDIEIIRLDQCLLDGLLLLLQAIATIREVTILDRVLGVRRNSCSIEQFIRIR